MATLRKKIDYKKTLLNIAVGETLPVKLTGDIRSGFAVASSRLKKSEGFDFRITKDEKSNNLMITRLS